jgi:hypothetical protein
MLCTENWEKASTPSRSVRCLTSKHDSTAFLRAATSACFNLLILPRFCDGACSRVVVGFAKDACLVNKYALPTRGFAKWRILITFGLEKVDRYGHGVVEGPCPRRKGVHVC